MCEFLSAVKGKTKTGRDKWYFLTHALIHGTPRGELLQQKYGGDDLIGHSAIREFFHLRSGDNWECTDFSTPANFPPIIVKAIKDGEFKGLGTPPRLLSGPAEAEYEKVRQAAVAECEKVQQPAWAEYEEVQQAAFWNLFANPENRAEGWR